MPRQRTDRAICLIVNRAKANRRDLADAILAAQQNGETLSYITPRRKRMSKTGLRKP